MERRLLRSSPKVVETGWWASRHPSGVPVAQVAAWNEEGHVNGGMFEGTYTPPRPFIRNTFVPNAQKLIESKYLPMVFNEIATGRATWGKLNNSLSKDLKDLMQETILGWNLIPNTPTTAERKGFNDPLIEDGTMYDTVKTRVVNKEKGS